LYVNKKAHLEARKLVKIKWIQNINNNTKEILKKVWYAEIKIISETKMHVLEDKCKIKMQMIILDEKKLFYNQMIIQEQEMLLQNMINLWNLLIRNMLYYKKKNNKIANKFKV